MAGVFFSYLRFFILYWGVADYKCCSSFWWTAKELSHTYTYIHAGGGRGKEPACRCRRWDAGSIPGSGRYSGEGNGNPLPYSGILAWIIPMDRGAWWAIVHGVSELDMTEWLSTSAFSSQPPPIQAGTWHWVKFHVLCNWFLLVTHFEHSSVYITLPTP